MKYTRLEINNRFFTDKHNTLFWFFIIIPLFSIVFGGLSVKLFISPYIKSYTQKVSVVPDTKVKDIVEKRVINQIYFLQAGVFSNKDNAQVLKKAIQEKGFSPFVVHDMDKFKVVIGFSENKDTLSNDRDKLNMVGFTSIINSLNYTELVDNGKGDKKSIVNYIKCLNNLLVIQIELSKRVKSDNNIDKSLINTEMNNLSQNFKILNDETIGMELMTPITKFNNEFINKQNEYIKSLDNKSIEDLNAIVIEWAILMGDFYDLFKESKSSGVEIDSATFTSI
jgi:hypothetical protein